MLECHRQGLCFNCDEPYVQGHQCQCLFYLEAADFPADDTTEEVAAELVADVEQPEGLVVSLHAIAGIRTEDTMHLNAYIHGHRLLALLDSGSTHNFINASVMRRIGLVTGNSAMRVTVANSNRVACLGMARNVAMCIGKEDFLITCFGIDLGGFDLVLGVDYLRTLGPILWDFEDLCLSFCRGDRPVLWKGVGSPHDDIHEPSLRVVTGDHQCLLLGRLLLHYGALFDAPHGLPPVRPYDHRIH